MVGVLGMHDEGESDDKIIAVADKDMSLAHIKTLEDFPEHLSQQVHRFFEDYKALENKKVKVSKIEGREKALGIIKDSIELYKKTHG